jgi:hypothetical protein
MYLTLLAFVVCCANVHHADETPDNKQHGSFGHTKGDMAFDANGGFWLVHSVPRFPANTGSGVSYDGYPEYASTYGQSFLCMSMGALPMHATVIAATQCLCANVDRDRDRAYV